MRRYDSGRDVDIDVVVVADRQDDRAVLYKLVLPELVFGANDSIDSSSRTNRFLAAGVRGAAISTALCMPLAAVPRPLAAL
jgi:hypothetical protein